MTEVILKVNEEVAKRFREISRKRFHGDEALAFEQAVELLFANEGQNLPGLEEIVSQIQDEIEAAGGVNNKDIDAYIKAYRRKKEVAES